MATKKELEILIEELKAQLVIDAAERAEAKRRGYSYGWSGE